MARRKSIITQQKLTNNYRPAVEDDFRKDGKFKLNHPFYMKHEHTAKLEGVFTTNSFMELKDFKNLIKKQLVYVQV